MMIARDGQTLVDRYAVPGLALFLVGQAVTGVIWGSRLETRVTTIEQRGSPAIDHLSRDIATLKFQIMEIERRMPRTEEAVHRMLVVEDRQRSVIEQLKQNADKMDSMLNELRKHMQEKN